MSFNLPLYLHCSGRSDLIKNGLILQGSCRTLVKMSCSIIFVSSSLLREGNWHKLLYGRCSVYRFNYASYIRYATLCPSVIYSLHDISIVHVVILVWCIQISSEALIASTISLLIGFRREPFKIRLRLR